MSQDLANEPSDTLVCYYLRRVDGWPFTGIALDSAGHDVTSLSNRPATSEVAAAASSPSSQSAVPLAPRHRRPGEHTTRASERRFLTADGVCESTPDSRECTSGTPSISSSPFLDDDHAARRGFAPPTARLHFPTGTGPPPIWSSLPTAGSLQPVRNCFPTPTRSFDYVAWRGVVSEAELSDAVIDAFDGRFTFYQGEQMLILAYFIPGEDGNTAPGDRRLNWVWYDTLSGRERETIFTDTTGTSQQFSVSPGQLRDPVESHQRERAAETLPPVFTDLVATTAAPFVQATYDLRPQVTSTVLSDGDAAFVARPHTPLAHEGGERCR